MMMIFGILLGVFAGYYKACTAEQPMITMGDDETSVVFRIVSKTPCDASLSVSLKNVDQQTSVSVPLLSQDSYVGSSTLSGYVRYAYFYKSNVTQGVLYSWSFSSDNNIGPFEFRIRNPNITGEVRIFLIGDMDLTSRSLPTRVRMNNTDWKVYDALIHVGDYAYDMNDDNGMRGDNYLNSLWTVMPAVPHLLIAGNHENFNNTRLFNFRLRMPDYNPVYTNNFWSYRRGNAYFLFVNYDYILTFYLDSNTLAQVLAYVETELKKSNDPQVKWKVVLSHRQIYCGEYATRDDCTQNYYYLKPFEALYRKYKVDLLLAGHEHFYERLSLVDYQFNYVKPQMNPNPSIGVSFASPAHPVQIMSACAGNTEGPPDPLITGLLTWNAIAYISCYADLTFTDTSVTHKIINSQDNSVMDQTIITKPPSVQPGSNTSAWGKILLIPLGFLLVIGLVYVVSKVREGMQSRSEGEYQHGKKVHGHNSQHDDAEAVLKPDSEPKEELKQAAKTEA